jgi:hypothetical protein
MRRNFRPPLLCRNPVLIISSPALRNSCGHRSKVCAMPHPKNTTVKQGRRICATGRASERIRKRRGK